MPHRIYSTGKKANVVITDKLNSEGFNKDFTSNDTILLLNENKFIDVLVHLKITVN